MGFSLFILSQKLTRGFLFTSRSQLLLQFFFTKEYTQLIQQYKYYQQLNANNANNKIESDGR